MKELTGFLKRSQKFRNNSENGKYIFILEKLHDIASNYQNNLPSTFAIENLYNCSVEDVDHVLVSLYPERKYFCQKLSNSTIYCTR